MTQTITISKEEYEHLKLKAKEFDSIIDKEGLDQDDLKLLEEAEKSKILEEKEARKKHPEFFTY